VAHRDCGKRHPSKGQKAVGKQDSAQSRVRVRGPKSGSYSAKSDSSSSVVREEDSAAKIGFRLSDAVQNDNFSEEEIAEMNEAARAAAKGFVK
jgi:hypothetical protein